MTRAQRTRTQHAQPPAQKDSKKPPPGHHFYVSYSMVQQTGQCCHLQLFGFSAAASCSVHVPLMCHFVCIALSILCLPSFLPLFSPSTFPLSLLPFSHSILSLPPLPPLPLLFSSSSPHLLIFLILSHPFCLIHSSTTTTTGASARSGTSCTSR